MPLYDSLSNEVGAVRAHRALQIHLRHLCEPRGWKEAAHLGVERRRCRIFCQFDKTGICLHRNIEGAVVCELVQNHLTIGCRAELVEEEPNVPYIAEFERRPRGQNSTAPQGVTNRPGDPVVMQVSAVAICEITPASESLDSKLT